MFDAAEAESLAVVEAGGEHRPIGSHRSPCDAASRKNPNSVGARRSAKSEGCVAEPASMGDAGNG